MTVATHANATESATKQFEYRAASTRSCCSPCRRTRDTNADVHFLGKHEALFVRALRFDAVGDDWIAMNVEIAVFDEIRIDRGVEPAVIDDVIYMTVNVVVHPAGVDDVEMRVVFAGDGGHSALCRRALERAFVNPMNTG
jgi:hypothetical protein